MAAGLEGAAGPDADNTATEKSEARALNVMTHLLESTPTTNAGADSQSAAAICGAQAQRDANGVMASFGAPLRYPDPRARHEIRRPRAGPRCRSPCPGALGLLEGDRVVPRPRDPHGPALGARRRAPDPPIGAREAGQRLRRSRGAHGLVGESPADADGPTSAGGSSHRHGACRAAPRADHEHVGDD